MSVTEENMPSVAQFYETKQVLITGATGFVGKVLLEKLLRCCSGISKVFLMIRPKNELSVEERLQNVFEEKLFENLREKQPDCIKKVVPIHSDLMESRMGLSNSDFDLLADNVQIIFHLAASVKFDEHLRHSFLLNVVGVKQMIQLAHSCKKLVSFVHVSTAYANCSSYGVEEKIYPSPVDPEKLLNALEWMSDDMISKVTPKLLGKKPNVYTFTKSLAEAVINKEAVDLPIVIIRPSIVVAAWREPLKGWIDNFNGPSGLYISIGKGILRSFKCDADQTADLVPVDFPVNMMLASAWSMAVHQTAHPLVFQVTTGGLNPCKWSLLETEIVDYFKRNPLEACFRRPNVQFVANDWLHEYWLLVSHMIPAYLMDIGYKLIGQSPRMVQTYQQLHQLMKSLEYCTMHSWQWSHTNMDMLKSKMSEADQKIFYFDPRELHWPTYVKGYCDGAKKFILKENSAGLPAARAHLRKLRNIRYAFNTVFLVVLWRTLIARSNLAQNSWYFILNLVSKFVQFFRLTSSIS